MSHDDHAVDILMGTSREQSSTGVYTSCPRGVSAREKHSPRDIFQRTHPSLSRRETFLRRIAGNRESNLLYAGMIFTARRVSRAS